MKVEDDVSFLTLYDALSGILTKTAERIFGRNQGYRRATIQDVTSTRIEAIKAETKHIGGAILLLRTGKISLVSTQTRQYLERIHRSHHGMNNQDLVEILKKKR